MKLLELPEVVIAIGANLGDRFATLRGAVAALEGNEGLVLQGVSAAFETDPVGGPEQPDYLNAVVLALSALAPGDVLAVCQGIEADFGRERRERWGARTLDLDLIAYGRPGSPSEVIREEPSLTLPHPRAHQRAFVLAPWAQVQPEGTLRMPDGEVCRVVDLLSVAPDRGGVRAAEVGVLR